MTPSLTADIAAIQSISSVPTILQAITAMTGLRFACIARVTAEAWTTCAVLDELDFGLKVGDPLDVATTLCSEVRDTQAAIVIDHVSQDAQYCNHLTPKRYGFESYISIPVYRSDGEYFGTLCALDPLPANLSNNATLATMTLFAQLISLQLENEKKYSDTCNALLDERQTAELREQFIAVLGHDLRNPLASILTGTDLLLAKPLDEKSRTVVQRIRRSGYRISGLVDDVLDFTRGKMGGGISLNLRHERALHDALHQVVAELQSAYPERTIRCDIETPLRVFCDTGRIGQLLSNLLKNALSHGDPLKPVTVTAEIRQGNFILAVVNHGPAIPEEMLARIFHPYWRASANAAHEGLGLGLFIVAEIARSHGAKLDVVSANQQTSFTFTLPRTYASS